MPLSLCATVHSLHAAPPADCLGLMASGSKSHSTEQALVSGIAAQCWVHGILMPSICCLAAILPGLAVGDVAECGLACR